MTLLTASARAEAISGGEKKDADLICCKDGKARPIRLQDNAIVIFDLEKPQRL
jgi:hypothetical protein